MYIIHKSTQYKHTHNRYACMHPCMTQFVWRAWFAWEKIAVQVQMFYSDQFLSHWVIAGHLPKIVFYMVLSMNFLWNLRILNEQLRLRWSENEKMTSTEINTEWCCFYEYFHQVVERSQQRLLVVNLMKIYFRFFSLVLKHIEKEINANFAWKIIKKYE